MARPIIFGQTADSIMSTFNKTFDKLEALKVKKDEEADKFQDQINKLKGKQSNAKAESKRASDYAAGIKNMMNGGGA